MRTAHQSGFAGRANGRLLAAAAGAGFDALVTTDKNIAYEHDPAALAATATHRFVRIHPDGRLETLSPR